MPQTLNRSNRRILIADLLSSTAPALLRSTQPTLEGTVRSLHTRLVMILTVSFLVLAVAQAEPSTMLVAGVALLAASALLGARYLAVIIVALRLMIGSRSREHREVLTRIAAPSHPNTAGRPRPRAPALSEAVA